MDVELKSMGNLSGVIEEGRWRREEEEKGGGRMRGITSVSFLFPLGEELMT